VTAGGPVVALRPMRWWDVAQVEALERTAYPADPWSAAAFWGELAGVPATRYYVVAEVDGRLVGYAGLRVVGAEADVQTVAVAPDLRGHGLGRRLVEDLLATAARRGGSRALLEVRADNAPAIALYESLGFDRIALRRGYYGPGADAVVMRRPLLPAEAAP